MDFDVGNSLMIAYCFDPLLMIKQLLLTYCIDPTLY